MATALTMCLVKACFHFLAPGMVLAYEGHLLNEAQKRQDIIDKAAGRKTSSEKVSETELKRREKEKLLNIEKPKMPIFRILFGHLMHGILPGCFFGAFGVASEYLDSVTAAL